MASAKKKPTKKRAHNYDEKLAINGTFEDVIRVSVAGNPAPVHNRKNLYQMYVDNGCRLGFFVNRNSWSDGKYAQVVKIDGVKDGEMIDGVPPYFNRKYPADHPKAGKIWQREITLKADWLDGGELRTGSGGTYSWERVYP